MALSFYFVFGIGVLGQPHMLHKFFMIKDPRRLRWMPLTLGASQILCLLVWLGLGLAVLRETAGTWSLGTWCLRRCCRWWG